MVRKAETVPWVRTGSITMAEEIINLQRLASFWTVSTDLSSTIIGISVRHRGRITRIDFLTKS